MGTSKLTGDAVVKLENKRKEIIIGKNQNRIKGLCDVNTSTLKAKGTRKKEARNGRQGQKG
jgi:hypothetical protein